MATTKAIPPRPFFVGGTGRRRRINSRFSVLFVQLAVAAMIFGSGCSVKPPTPKGVKDGSLPPCPSSPNCVASMGGKSGRDVAPLDYTGSRSQAMDDLAAVLRAMGGDVVQQQQDYLWAEFTSKVFGFVDDVEFYLPPDQSLIHVRSAARQGYYDFGVNARRVEKIRKAFQERQRRH